MRYVLIAAIALLPSLSHAKFECFTAARGLEKGYKVKELENSYAEVSRDGQKLATLACLTPEGQGEPSNAPRVGLSCFEEMEGGYRFQIVYGGFAGISATLRMEGEDSRPISMRCKFSN